MFGCARVDKCCTNKEHYKGTHQAYGLDYLPILECALQASHDGAGLANDAHLYVEHPAVYVWLNRHIVGGVESLWLPGAQSRS